MHRLTFTSLCTLEAYVSFRDCQIQSFKESGDFAEILPAGFPQGAKPTLTRRASEE